MEQVATNENTLYEGRYISEVKVSGTPIPLESFEKVAGYPSFFTVTIVYLTGDTNNPASIRVTGIETLYINHLDETGQIGIPGDGDHVLVIVSNPSDATEFEYGLADYDITIEKT